MLQVKLSILLDGKIVTPAFYHYMATMYRARKGRSSKQLVHLHTQQNLVLNSGLIYFKATTPSAFQPNMDLEKNLVLSSEKHTRTFTCAHSQMVQSWD